MGVLLIVLCVLAFASFWVFATANSCRPEAEAEAQLRAKNFWLTLATVIFHFVVCSR